MFVCPMSEKQENCLGSICKLSVSLFCFCHLCFNLHILSVSLSDQHFLLVLPRDQQFLHLFSPLINHTTWHLFWVYTCFRLSREELSLWAACTSIALHLCSISLPDLVTEIGNLEWLHVFGVLGSKHTEKK